MNDDFPALVGTEWLAAHLGEPDLRILDCTWHHVSTNLDGRTQYRGRHLPGSMHFDIDHVADAASPLPHMLPSETEFATKVGLLGIGDGDRVVVYDRQCGGSAASRVWWMFRAFGYENIALLDGGYGKWTKEKLPTEMAPVRPEQKRFTARFQPALVRGLAAMKANLASRAEQVVDARGPARFDGIQPDLYPTPKPGHIPGAINLPWGDLIDPQTGAFLASGALAARFNRAGIDIAAPIVATCGSGISSPVLALALHLLGNRAAAVYDGSWAEWGASADTPAETARQPALAAG